MSHRLIVKPSAEKQLENLPKPIQRRVLGKLIQLEAELG